MFLEFIFSFYFWSKLLPHLFMPLSCSLILLMAYLYWKKKWSLKVAILILFVFSFGIITDLLWYLVEFKWLSFNHNRINNADAIVVLSGEYLPSNPRRKLLKNSYRFSNGIKLFENKKASKIIFTSSFNPFKPNQDSEGYLYKIAAINTGIDEDSILLTKKLKHTIEEAKEVKRLINPYKGESKKIILVTSASHMFRAKKIFEKQNLIVQPYPVDFQSKKFVNANRFKNPSYWIPNAVNLSSSSSALREMIGIIYYSIF